MIHVRRTWTCGKVGLPKSKASKAPVPLHPLLAEFMQAWKNATPYSQPSDWVFASFRCKGKQPRVANMLVEDHLRPAAVKAGVHQAEGDASAASASTTCGIQPGFVSGPLEDRSENGAGFATAF